jgi:hypothetical protein
MPEVLCYSCRVGRCEECWGIACTHAVCGGMEKEEPIPEVETPTRVSARGSICTLL